MKNNSADVVVHWEIWGTDLPLISGYAAERSGSGSKKSNGWSGAVSGTPINGAERRAENFAAPLRSHALVCSALPSMSVAVF